MSPLTFVGVGWCLTALGVSGLAPLILTAAAIAGMLVGLHRIRWRNQELTWTFWAVIALLLSLVALVAGLPGSLGVLLAVSALLTVIGLGLATGVRACLMTSTADVQDKVDQLRMVRVLIVATFGLSVVAVLISRIVASPPDAVFFIIYTASLAVSLWLGVLLIQVRLDPSVQEHPAGRA